jgi:hypothetical protein
MDDTDAMRTATMALRHNLFGSEANADQVCRLFTSWEQRAEGYEMLAAGLCRVMANHGVDVERLLDDLALHVAGELWLPILAQAEIGSANCGTRSAAPEETSSDGFSSPESR